MNYTLHPLEPFGALIENRAGTGSMEDFPPEQLKAWVSEYRLVVFRGYEQLSKQEFALWGQKLGKPLQWVFGAINELKVNPKAENYIFTDAKVPVHWDGAFKGKIPHIILFQCLKAPKKEDKGGTTFVNTESMLANATPGQRAEWEDLSITYTTEKIVHYGGSITQKFIHAHEEEGQPVIRYAEPVEDLNPVSLSIKGLKDKSEQDFIAEMEEILYDPAHLYTHRWEDGDFVMADNHTLLHGREAFHNPNERHIQRINLMHRPEKGSLWRFLDNCLTIRRKEFFVAELPIFVIPLLLGITAWADFLQPTLWLGLAAIFLLFNLGDMINCYADYELDSIFKSHLSNAVYELGKNNVKWQIIGSGIIAMALTVWIAISTGQYYLIGVTLFGGFVGLQYSIGPFKFKSRGIWQLFCLWGIIFFGPMLYTGIITDGFPTWMELVVFGFYGFHQMGIILLNTAEDLTEDRAEGLNTFTIRLGLHKAMNFAFWLVVVSGLVMQGSLAWLMHAAEAPVWLYSLILAFTVGWIKIVVEYWQIIRLMNSMEEDDAIKEVKKKGWKVPEWLKVGAYTFLVPILGLFIWNTSLSKTTQSAESETFPFSTKVIQGQRWMTQNLAIKQDREGNPVEFWFPGNDPFTEDDYGLLYSYETACKVCPEGWRLPTNAEWEALFEFGMNNVAGNHKDPDWWKESGNSNTSGFSLRPTGYGNNGEFPDNFQEKTLLWSSDRPNEHDVWTYVLEIGLDSVRKAPQHPTYAFSVRCVQEAIPAK